MCAAWLHAEKDCRRSFWGIILFEVVLAAFISCSLVLHFAIDFTGSMGSVWPENAMRPLTMGDGAWMFLGAIVLFLVLEMLRRCVFGGPACRCEGLATESTKQAEGYLAFLRRHLAMFFIIWVSILAIWIVIWLNYYPGTSMNDQLAIIDDPYLVANNHPLLYNLALSSAVAFGADLFGDMSAGFALYVVVQMLVCGVIVSGCLVWLRYRRAPLPAVISVAVVFALCPLIINYSMSALKDTIFAYVVLLWFPVLCELVFQGSSFWEKRSNIAAISLLIILTAITRNNGLYVAAAMGALLVLIGWGHRKRVFAVVLIAGFVSLLPNIYLSSMGTVQLFRESVGVPLQQLAAVVCENPESLTEEELAFIDQIMPIESIREHYAPMSVDSIKFDGDFDTWFLQGNRLNFMKTWISVGLKNPGIYIRAFLSQTYGYWDFFSWDPYQSVLFRISDNIRQSTDIEAMEEWGLENRSFYPDPVAQTLDSVLRRTSVFFSGGACLLFILLATFATVARAGSARWLLPIVPIIFVWGTLLIATPLALAFRYAFPLAVTLPFAIAFSCRGFRLQ